MKYVPAKGARLSNTQAQVFGERMEMLQEEHNGEITAEIVLDDAQEPDSPLHDYFEWNDGRAGALYREQQARYLFRAIHLVVKVDEKEETIRAFVRVKIQETEPEPSEDVGAMESDGVDTLPETRSVYVLVQRAASDEELRQQIVEDALNQLYSWRRRYQQYQELAKIFGLIDAIQETLDLAPEVEMIGES